MKAKICGIGRAEDISAMAGAAYAGFVFYPPSPRALDKVEAAALAHSVPSQIARVGLFVDPETDFLDSILAEVPLEYLQLHGQETPERVAVLRRHAGLPVIKAVRVSTDADLEALRDAEEVADQILCDALPSDDSDAVLPGGNGESFDWRLVAGRRWRKPWILAGGLTPENVAEAVRLSGAEQVDVSSGVEESPGRKSPERIVAFLRAAGVTPSEGAHAA